MRIIHRSGAGRFVLALTLAGAGFGMIAPPIADALGSAVDEPTALPFEDLAKRALAAHGHEATSPEGFDLAAFFEAHYLVADLGLYELTMAVHRLKDKTWADSYGKIGGALLDAQLAWIERIDPGEERSKEARADIATLRRWVGKWPAGELGRASADSPGTVVQLLEAKEDIVAASARLRTAMLAGGGIADPRTLEDPVRIVLAPTRADFVELMALAGWAKPDLRSIFWQAGVDDWLEFSVDDRKVIALEYVANGRAAGDYAAGTSMNERAPTGMQQQVTQLALLRLVEAYYAGQMPVELGKGLVMNLVIDVFGEIRARVDGDLSSNVTQKREIFVAGGQSEGGRLPQNVAETRWRMDAGKDRCVRILRQVQKSGKGSREGSKNDLANFLLQSKDESERAIVSAPMFGAAAAEVKAPPAIVQGDYLEFVRAYQCGFVHWLQENGAGSRKASTAAWSKLLDALANPARTKSAEEIITELYEAPLSDADCSPNTLEGKFLRWLSTQR